MAAAEASVAPQSAGMYGQSRGIGDGRPPPAPTGQGFTRPSRLRVARIQDRATDHFAEHWAHADEGGFHYPLATPQIFSVRSAQCHAFAAGAPSPAAQTVRLHQDTDWTKSATAPPTAAALMVRLQEEAWVTRKGTGEEAQRVHELQENFFVGVNDLASLAMTVSCAMPSQPQQTFRKLAKTASAPHAVAAHAAATAVPALRSLLHSPMLSMTSNAEHPFHVLESMPEGNEDAMQASGSFAVPPIFAEGGHSATTLKGASVWGASAHALTAELGVLGQVEGQAVTVTDVSSMSHVLHALQHGALLAALRRMQEGDFRQPVHDGGVDSLWREQEGGWRSQALSPRAVSVQKKLNEFKSMPYPPGVQQVRRAQESFQSSEAQNSRALALRVALEDPFLSYKSSGMPLCLCLGTCSSEVTRDQHDPNLYQCQPAPLR